MMVGKNLCLRLWKFVIRLIINVPDIDAIYVQRKKAWRQDSSVPNLHHKHDCMFSVGDL